LRVDIDPEIRNVDMWYLHRTLPLLQKLVELDCGGILNLTTWPSRRTAAGNYLSFCTILLREVPRSRSEDFANPRSSRPIDENDTQQLHHSFGAPTVKAGSWKSSALVGRTEYPR
jgi:hypothetical protein